MSNDTTAESQDAQMDTEAEEPPVEPASQDNGSGMASFLGSGGIKQILMEETFEDPATGHRYSQADLVADVINVMRMDTKQMCALHGIDVEVDKMTAERAAELLEGVAGDDGVDIIEVFRGIEDDQDLIFQQEMDEAHYEKYMSIKEDMLYSVPDDGPANVARDGGA